LAKDADIHPPDAWLDDVLTDMVRRIPTAKAIRDSFQLDITPAFVEAPDEAIKATRLEDIAAKEADMTRRLAEIEQIDVNAKREKAYLELSAERERLNRERRITEEVLAHEKKQRQERIEQTLNAVAGQLHTLVGRAGRMAGPDSGQASCTRWVGRVKNFGRTVPLHFTDDAELARVWQNWTTRSTTMPPAGELTGCAMHWWCRDIAGAIRRRWHRSRGPRIGLPMIHAGTGTKAARA
jgi:hypothetical protein